MSISRRGFIQILAGIAAFDPGSVKALSLYKTCDVYQGFNFRKDGNSRIGFITSLNIGGVAGLSPDITVHNPLSQRSNMRVFAVLSEANWRVRKTQPLQFSGQISARNKNLINAALLRSLTQIDTVFQFSVYEYDASTRSYYKAFHSNNNNLKGRIEKYGGQLSLDIGNVRNRGVQSPENYSFSISMVPESIEHELHLAVSSTAKVVKQWGVKDRKG